MVILLSCGGRGCGRAFRDALGFRGSEIGWTRGKLVEVPGESLPLADRLLLVQQVIAEHQVEPSSRVLDLPAVSPLNEVTQENFLHSVAGVFLVKSELECIPREGGSMLAIEPQQLLLQQVRRGKPCPLRSVAGH